MQWFLTQATTFAFFYPLVMTYIWMTGAIIYYLRFERRQPTYNQPPDLPEYPFVSVLVPCYNEENNIEATLKALTDMHYPNYEIIAIDDGSSDASPQILNKLKDHISRLRVVHLTKNQGKAIALKSGALAARGDFLVCIDGDAILDHYAITWIMHHFVHSPRVGAVTGNPRVRTRTTLLGRIQVGEFSAIIGLLKRAQRVYGRVFTISGVICAFRRVALHRVGYWSESTLTEDIDISWRLQLDFWDVRFEPRALCWILMPETISGLFQQRLRWAIGGGEALKNNFLRILQWQSRRMWGIYLEYLFSILWSYTLLALIAIWAINLVYPLPFDYIGLPWIPQWAGVVLGLTCLAQFALSMFIDRRYDYRLLSSFFSIIWYPLFYWTLNWLVAVIAFPMAMFRRPGQRGKWETIDRGISQKSDVDNF